MNFRSYPEYKDSGMKLLSNIPAHWDVQKLKHIASVRFSSVDKKTEDGERPAHLCNYQDVYYNDYITPDIAFMEATASPAEITSFMLRKGNVIVTKDSESWDDIAVSAYVPSDLDGVLCGYHLAQIHPYSTLIDGEYLFRSFSAHGINDQFRVAATGITRYGLGKYWIDNAFFPVPPIDEQHAIKTFLNRETAKIDALIEKKERLIELLQEKRNVLITHAVTKGLDPNAPMKDSGVEWIGEIPEHWKLVRGKIIFQLMNGYAFKGEYFSKESGEGPIVVTPGNFNVDGGLYFNDKNTTRYLVEYPNQFVLKKSDLIIVLTDLSYKNLILGRTEFVEFDDLLLNQRIAKIIFNEGYKVKIYAEYLRYLLNTQLYRDQLISYTTGATVNHTSPTKVRDRFCLVPPIEEQGEIAKELKKQEFRITELIGKIRNAIDILKEYRTALISAAITGKIDVREEAA